MMFDMIFGAFTGSMFLMDVIKCAGYVIVGMIIMRLLINNYSNILVFVPVIVLLLCAPLLISYLKVCLNHIAEAMNQFSIVGGFSSEAYREYMSYLYLEPLGNALFMLVHCIPRVAAPVLTYLDYRKLIINTQHKEEIRKMKIQDL